jgi:UDP-N-acetylmuramoyl-L-alanyl-D-glutamate--2,6-diaminopimelate ligase
MFKDERGSVPQAHATRARDPCTQLRRGRRQEAGMADERLRDRDDEGADRRARRQRGGREAGRGITLSQVLADATFFACDDIVATGCSDDPDTCRPGDVFVARLTAEGDGHDDVERALDRGVAGVVAERIIPTFGTPLCIVPESGWALARLKHAFAGDPARRMRVIAITGTSGKTTTAWLAASVLAEAGLRVGLLSDLGCLTADATEPVAADLARPDVLADWLRRLGEDGCTHAVVEVSSVMLAADCLAGIDCDTVAVTNLAAAHLDIHGTTAAYHAVKARILDCLGADGCLVATADDDRVGRLIDRRIAAAGRGTVITAGLTAPADVGATPVERTLFGQTFLVRAGGHSMPVAVSTPVAAFVRDTLLAVAIGLRYRVPLERIVRGIEACGSVAGRMERIDRGQPHAVFVDHPTSGHAVAATLGGLRRLTSGRLVVLAETACAQRLVADATDAGDPLSERDRRDADARMTATFSRRTLRWADDCLVVPPTLMDELGRAADVMAYARIDRLLSSLGEQDCLLVLGDVNGRCESPIDPDGDPLPLAAVVDGWLQLAHVPQPIVSGRHAA